MEHLVYILNKEPAKTIFQVENNKDDIIAQLKGISQLRPEFETRVKIVFFTHKIPNVFQ